MKIVYGAKGTGKTKTVINSANDAVETAKGHIVFVTDTKRYMYDLKREIRFIDVDDFAVTGEDGLRGFLKGIIAANADNELVYVDGVARIAGKELSALGDFFAAIEKLVDEIDVRLDHTHILVLSGSVPPGVPANIYQRLIHLAHKKDVKTVLDTTGEPFRLGLEEKPFLIKPNSKEFEQAFKNELKSGKGPLEVARQIVDGGIPYVCISMGADGARLLDQEHTYRAKARPVEAKGLTGAGDSMVAGMCYALRKRLDTADMLRYAMACAAGSVRQEGTLLAREADVKELLPQVELEIIA